MKTFFSPNVVEMEAKFGGFSKLDGFFFKRNKRTDVITLLQLASNESVKAANEEMHSVQSEKRIATELDKYLSGQYYSFPRDQMSVRATQISFVEGAGTSESLAHVCVYFFNDT